MRFVNDIYPTLIVVLVVVLLAGITINNSNRNQKQVIEAVKQAQSERQLEIDRTLEAIKQKMDPNEWQEIQRKLHESKPVR